jgi:AraC family transcriptional regulator, regulatory protein of adaptative response / methylated-DNA-[protein]-cysteine methyltransferase
MATMSTAAAFLDSREFARMARAIAFIDAHFREQPRIADIARAAHLSEFHFSRQFRRWAGLSPHQYLAFVTARAAGRALPRTPSVLEAALEVGLSGPGRLHDLMVTLEALSPGEVKSGGEGVALSAGFTDTPFGRALLASSPRGITRLSFTEAGGEAGELAALAAAWPRAQVRRDDAGAAGWAQRIWGGRRDSVPLAVRGTNFQVRIWQALLERGGEVTNYASLSRAAGVPGAARAAGQAVGANPVAWLIPCHTVLRADGALGGYHWGGERKRAMLAWDSLRARQAAATAREAQVRA